MKRLKSKLIHLLTAILLFSIIFGCGNAGIPVEKSRPKVLNPILQYSPNCENGTLLNYENFGEIFMLNYCTGCHSRDLPEAARSGAPVTVNLDRPEDMAVWRTKMIALVLNSTTATMPPSGHLRERDRKKLTEWLYCGAPSEQDSVIGTSE